MIPMTRRGVMSLSWLRLSLLRPHDPTLVGLSPGLGRFKDSWISRFQRSALDESRRRGDSGSLRPPVQWLA
ncbi:hypothetical protein C2E23DRAFT_854460 [Lenzites betulinus]|nr:hypothetical protein C2E23DRAFT_854460 [Lenzites betulinus]